MPPREYLFSLEQHGIKLGLDTISHFVEAAGRPHLAYPVVHIAGTNGKGSVAAMLGAMLRAAGYRTGQFTSPHLIDVNERFIVDGVPISDAELDENIAYFRAIAETRRPFPPTFFEVNTAIAFRWFAQRAVDCALIEVGLGGRFDATNVALPELSVIVSIDYDHMQFLGDSLEKIAFEKAGIIKPGKPVVIGETKPAPREVLLARAEELESPAAVLGRDFHFTLSGSALEPQISFEGRRSRILSARIGLAGKHQGQNAAVALAAAEYLAERFARLDEPARVAGLAAAHWPCRLEKVIERPPVYIDVAHNPAGAARLAETLPWKCVTVLAVSKDKDARGIIRILAPVSKRLILTQFSGARALPVSEIAAAAQDYPHQTAPGLEDAIDTGMRLASAESPLLITGSLFTAGEARNLLIHKYNAPLLHF